MDNENDTISKQNDELFLQGRKKVRKESKRKTTKRISVEHTIDLIAKEGKTKNEIVALASYLTEFIDYFKKLKDSGDMQKLEKVISVLHLENFNPDEDIIRFGEEGEKFYIVLTGKVSINKPIYVQKEMKVKDFLILLKSIEKIEVNQLKYERIVQKNTISNKDIKMLSKMMENCENNEYLNKELTFFIEEDQKLGEFSQGFCFGEIALIKKFTRNATIKAITNCKIATIIKSDYNKIMRELEEKRLEAKFVDFKQCYPLFQSWTLNQMIRLFNCFSNIEISQGDYLYRQNDDANSIYIIENGIFEVYSMVSFNWINDFLTYIMSAKNNLVHHLDTQKHTLRETDLREFFDLISIVI